MTETKTLSRRAAIAGATALAAAVPSIGTALAVPSCSADDAELIGLVDEWLQVERELVKSECRLADLVDAAQPGRPRPGKGMTREELVAHWDEQLQFWGPGHPENETMRRWRADALQKFDAWDAEEAANREANGAAALEVHVTALEDRRQKIVEAVHLASATTLAGVLAKLQMVSQEDEFRDPGEWTRRLQAVAIADLERLAAGEGRLA